MDTNARVRRLNEGEAPPRAEYVLYWALANRRLDSNHALAYAAGLANEQGLPLLVYEALTFDHPWANDRFHTFVLQGVPENEARAAELGAGYVFYHRAGPGDPNDALYRLAEKAAAVVMDDYPSYIPRVFRDHVRLSVPCYLVDASCVVPMSLIGKQQYAAYAIRPRIHKLLGEYLQAVPEVRLKQRWTGGVPALHTRVREENIAGLVASSQIDHSVPPSAKFPGGRKAALERMREFLEHNLARYGKLNREPSAKATSQLSPYLHFGHISSLEIALAVKQPAEEFLEQLLVRRELAFNFAFYGPRPDRIESLPEWVQATLRKHAGDRREYLYDCDQFDRAATHDPLWNAAQRELLRDGIIHGYYRMYWGKKIIEWSKTPQEALDTMIFLNDRYALDGRDPNTYTNILWCLGLHDRPWTERAVFGMVRYMNYDGMKRKTNVDAYMSENGSLQPRLF